MTFQLQPKLYRSRSGDFPVCISGKQELPAHTLHFVDGLHHGNCTHIPHFSGQGIGQHPGFYRAFIDFLKERDKELIRILVFTKS